jgi:hypothetical protein
VGFAVMVGLWVFYGSLRWIAVVGFVVSDFFFFFFYVASNIENIFQIIFKNATKHRKKNYFP